MPWGANLLRLTAFPTPDSESRIDWWERATGQKPDHTSNNLKQATFDAKGVVGDSTLILRIQPLRIDWLLSPPEPELPTVTNLVDDRGTSIDQFVRVIEAWLALEDTPEFVRLAVGATLLDPVESHEAGYRRLGELLPAIQLDPNSRDFNYQINRPRNSRVVADLLVNRISKWNVLKVQHFAGVGGDSITLGTKTFACRVETDVNSSSDYSKTLSKATCRELFHEFLSLSTEIADRGDVA